MSEIQFLTFADVVEIHEYQIENFGGASGLRDIELLKSAIGMPESTFGGAFLHPTIYEMAAAYLYHLVENHPFVDGNKRVGAMAALVFLDINNIDFELVKDKKDVPDDPDDASSDLSIYQMFIFPNSDPEKAEENLENAGYIVSVFDDKISMVLAGGSYDGCKAVLMAYNEENDDDGIFIWYFEEKENADEAWDDIEKFAESLNESAEEEDIDMVCKKSGKLIYYGTKQAIKDAK